MSTNNSQILKMRGLNAAYYSTTGVIMPLLPIYFANQGYSSVQIGILMMIGSFVAIFAQPFWGFVSDRLQRVKSIILMLWGLTVAASVALFAVSGFTPTLIFMLLLYFFMLPAVPLLDSMVIQSVREVGIPYSSVRVFGSIGFSLVALGAGFALPTIGGIGNIRYLYWAMWILPFLLVISLRDVRAGGPRISLGSAGILLRNRRYLWYLFMVFLLMVPHRANDVLLSLYMHQLHAANWMVSASWALAAVGEVIGFTWAGKYAHRYNDLSLLGIVSILYAVRWLLYAWIHDPWILFLLQASHACTYGVFWIVAVQHATRLVPDEFRSTGQSLLSAVFLGLAGIVGGFAGGEIQDLLGSPGLYLSGSMLAAAAAVLFFGTRARYRLKGMDSPVLLSSKEG